MDAQDSIAAGVLVDLRAQADENSTIAEALGGDVVDQILRNEIISKELKSKMSTPGDGSKSPFVVRPWP